MAVLVCCVLAYWLVKHLPEIAGEAASAFAAGLRGEESPAMAARRARLADAGIDPAAGGAFRQYAGNLLRDFWLDQDQARTARRAKRPDAGPQRGVFGRLRDAFDDEVGRRAQAWRDRDTRPKPEGKPGPDETFPGPTEPGPSSSGDTAPEAPSTDNPEPGKSSPEGDPEPVRVDSTLGPEARPATDTTAPPALGPAPSRLDWPQPEPARTATAVLDPERNDDMTQAVATNGGAVTGVVSGAAEARAIQRYLENATAQYEIAMANARKRIHALGEQTLAVVQMSAKSDVVNSTAQAAESIAAAQAGANTCKAEVIPLMGLVARRFDQRNS